MRGHIYLQGRKLYLGPGGHRCPQSFYKCIGVKFSVDLSIEKENIRFSNVETLSYPTLLTLTETCEWGQAYVIDYFYGMTFA